MSKPEPQQHQCPYGGASKLGRPCGERGWLCQRCREDRADARASAGNRLQAQEEYATALDARLSTLEVSVQETETADEQRLIDCAELLRRIEALESRLPGPQTPLQDLGTFDAQTGQRVDEPTQHGEARTCGNCGHGFDDGPTEPNLGKPCGAIVPMWADDWVRNCHRQILPAFDATHCAAWTPKEAKA